MVVITFKKITSGSANGGTILETTDGTLYSLQYTGNIQARWFNVTGDRDSSKDQLAQLLGSSTTGNVQFADGNTLYWDGSAWSSSFTVAEKLLIDSNEEDPKTYIASVADEKVGHRVDTIADFKALTDTPERVYVDNGLYGSNYFLKVDSGTNNDGTVIETAAGAVYKLQHDGPVHAAWFGYNGTHVEEQDRMAAKLGSEAHHVLFADCYSVYWNGTKWQGKAIADRIYAVRISKKVRYIRVGSSGNSVTDSNNHDCRNTGL